jgi:hypothetical protein
LGNNTRRKEEGGRKIEEWRKRRGKDGRKMSKKNKWGKRDTMENTKHRRKKKDRRKLTKTSAVKIVLNTKASQGVHMQKLSATQSCSLKRSVSA